MAVLGKKSREEEEAASPTWWTSTQIGIGKRTSCFGKKGMPVFQLTTQLMSSLKSLLPALYFLLLWHLCKIWWFSQLRFSQVFPVKAWMVYSNLSTFLVGLNSQRSKPQVGNYSATAERCDIFHQKMQCLFFKSFASPACFRWGFCCVCLVGSDPSEMALINALLALVPSLWPPSARHQGEALTIADTVKGHLYSDQVECCGKKSALKNPALCCLKLADAFKACWPSCLCKSSRCLQKWG